MHLGNIFTAVLSWLSVKSRGGRWVLRIEDLDPQRSRLEYARLIEDDLRWLGLDWDEGGLDDLGPCGPYRQSLRSDIYAHYMQRLADTGLVYPCRCRRSDILATQAPHQSDGRVVYRGTCRPAHLASLSTLGTFPTLSTFLSHLPTPSTLSVPPSTTSAPPSTISNLQSTISNLQSNNCSAASRLYVPDCRVTFTDRVYGPQVSNLATDCGDFIVRRADGAWAYQLAVVVDDALMGITEVMRGNDLLVSAPQQIYLMRLLGLPVPQFAHLPLVCNAAGQRLSKRDASMSMEQLRRRLSPEEILGRIACLAGWQPDFSPVSLATLLARYRDPAPRPSVLLPETI